MRQTKRKDLDEVSEIDELKIIDSTVEVE